jgi:hypothetical protein
MNNFWHKKVWTKFTLSLLILWLPCASFAFITRINVSNDGIETNWETDPNRGHTFKMSPDGKYVAFTTYANNLIEGDWNGLEDVFVRNTETNTTALISTTKDWRPWNGWSRLIDMSENGRYILFQSNASNLIDWDGNWGDDLFIRDTVLNSTTRVNVNNAWQESDRSDFVGWIAMTPDARYIVFYSSAWNIVADDNNGQVDIFVRDRIKWTTTRVNVSSFGDGGDKWIPWEQEANDYSFSACWAWNPCPKSITPNGRYVIFASNASNLVADDTNELGDIFVRDLVERTTTRVTLSSADNKNTNWWLDADLWWNVEWSNIGSQANDYFTATTFAAISNDGRYVTFDSNASNLVTNDNNNAIDIFKRDTLKNITTRESVAANNNESINANGAPHSHLIDVSNDGRYILFKSMASNFVPWYGVYQRGDTNGNRDWFVRDTLKRTTTLATADNSGHNWREYSLPTAMTPDGRFVLFHGIDDNIYHDNSYTVSAFLRDLKLGKTTKVSENDEVAANATNNMPISITPDGTYSLLRSMADNLVPNDTNNQWDIFLKLNKETLSYTWVFNFQYPEWLKYKAANNAWTVNVTFTSSWKQYQHVAPLVVVAKAASNKTIEQLQTESIASFRKILRQNFSISKGVSRTANGANIVQLYFSGRIWWVTKTYIVSFMKEWNSVYVLTVSGIGSYSNDINAIADTITRTRGTTKTNTSIINTGGGESQSR